MECSGSAHIALLELVCVYIRSKVAVDIDPIRWMSIGCVILWS